MSDDALVTVADCLWPHEAGMMNSLLEAAGIQTVLRGALSTSGEIPGPVSSILVKSEDESQARALLEHAEAAADPDAASFFCEECDETVPAVFAVCPMCAPVQEAVAPVESKGLSQTWLLVLLSLMAAAIYTYVAR